MKIFFDVGCLLLGVHYDDGILTIMVLPCVGIQFLSKRARMREILL